MNEGKLLHKSFVSNLWAHECVFKLGIIIKDASKNSQGT